MLAHLMTDGSLCPICFASRTLSPIKIPNLTMRPYLSSSEYFTPYTDCKPLTYFFHSHRSSPPMASACIQRWALILGTYQYRFCYRPGKDIGDADCLSRLPLPDHPPDVPIPSEILLAVDKLSQSPVSAKDIQTWTSKDSVLSSVQRFIMNGWPDKVSQPDLLPYFSKHSEQSLDCGFCGTPSRSTGYSL